MGKTAEKVSKSEAKVKSGAKAVKGLDLDLVKSAMTPDKVKVATPGLKEKKKDKSVAASLNDKKKTKFERDFDAAKIAKKKEKSASKKVEGKENVDKKSADGKDVTTDGKKKNEQNPFNKIVKEKKPPIEVKHLELSTIESGVKAFLQLLADKSPKEEAEEKKEEAEEKNDEAEEKVDEDTKMETSKSDLFDGKDELLPENSSKIFLQISGIKIPSSKDTHTIKTPLPHGFLEPDANILLVVKDFKKGDKHDHDETLVHYQDMVRNAKVNANVEVMPFRQLRMEFKEFELKRHLASRIDRVLVDTKIMADIPRYLGKAFYKKKKMPVGVHLWKQDLKEEISNGIRMALLPLNNHGSSNCVAVGRTNQTPEELTLNVQTMVKKIRGAYPGGWKNVRSLALLNNNKSIFLYMSERSTDDLEIVNTLNYARNKRSPVEGELSTLPGATVTVMPGGDVTVKRVPDPEWDEKVGISEYDEDEQGPAYKRSKMDYDGVEELKKKLAEDETTTKKKEETVVDDSDDEEIDSMEMEYMKKVAAEEEEIERKEAENMEKLKEADKEKSTASDADDASDAADDDINAENLVSDGSDDSDDVDLVMKRNEEGVEEETQKKTKKIKKTQLRKERKEAAKSPRIEKQTKSPKLKAGKKSPSQKHQGLPKKHFSKNKLNGVKAGKVSKK